MVLECTYAGFVTVNDSHGKTRPLGLPTLETDLFTHGSYIQFRTGPGLPQERLARHVLNVKSRLQTVLLVGLHPVLS